MRESHEALLHRMLQLSCCSCTVACISASKHTRRFSDLCFGMQRWWTTYHCGIKECETGCAIPGDFWSERHQPSACKCDEICPPMETETRLVSGLMIRPRSAGLWQHDTTSCWTVFLCSMTSMCIVCQAGPIQQSTETGSTIVQSTESSTIVQRATARLAPQHRGQR
jgi:hypothetical protein